MRNQISIVFSNLGIRLSAFFSCMTRTVAIYEPLIIETTSHLPICSDSSPAVCEQLRHVIITHKLPQTGLQVQVPVEAQSALASDDRAVLIRQSLSDALYIPGGLGQKAMSCGHLIKVQQIGAPVVSHSSAISAQSQLKVGQCTSGDHREHAWSTQKINDN